MSARGQYRQTVVTQGRGQYGVSRVGNSVFHTVADREEARAQLKRDVGALHADLSREILHTSPEHPWGLASDTSIQPKWLAWWKASALPFFNDFRDWEAARNPSNWTRFGGYVGFGEEWATDWDVYQRWNARLAALRDAALKLGVALKSPPPMALPTTVIEDVGDVLKRAGKEGERAVTDVWKLAKYGIIGALLIGGVVAVATVAHDLRSDEDPSKRYRDFAKKRSKEALALAL